VDVESKLLFRHFYDQPPLPEAGSVKQDVEVRKTLLGARRVEVQRPFVRSAPAAAERRRRLRVGIPRVLNIWSTAPFWRTYLETLGIQRQNVVFSDETTEELWMEGGKYGSIDPCYPSKVGQAHIHNLLFHHHSEDKPLAYIFNPVITHVPSYVKNSQDTSCCPIVQGSPNVLKAAFTKEVDFFKSRNITYLDHSVTLVEPHLLKKQMFECWKDHLGVTEDESDFAVDQGFAALAKLDEQMEAKGRALLEEIERDNRVAILLLSRPYHLDPGLNHGILEEFQVLGYPVLSMRSVPKDEGYLARYFAEDLAKGRISSPLEINDVWPENYSANSAQKVWAAKFAAHHPNVVVLDLSSFKCGHDAPTYGIIDSIIGTSGTPYSALHDIDANKPGGSIKIRVKTYAHSLGLHKERLEDTASAKDELAYRMERKRLELLQLKQKQLEERRQMDPAIARQIAETIEKVRLYEQARAARTDAEKAAEKRDALAAAGILRLGIKRDESGTIARL
jgi:predicted nucleotide-binding protein (sugar kinase/HSP70/actin superfamily)